MARAAERRAADPKAVAQAARTLKAWFDRLVAADPGRADYYARLKADAEQLAAEAPPLTDDQRDRLRLLLAPFTKRADA